MNILRNCNSRKICKKLIRISVSYLKSFIFDRFSISKWKASRIDISKARSCENDWDGMPYQVIQNHRHLIFGGTRELLA